MDGFTRIRVLLTDDSPTALKAISGFLRSEERLELVGTARDGVALLHQVNDLIPELVLVDLSMPEMNGLEATKALRKTPSQLRIIIFTELSGTSLKEECLRCGADGFIYKSELSEKLMDEIRRLFPEKF